MKLGYIDHQHLLDEKSLWDIYKASRGIRESRFNSIVSICVALLCCIYCVAEPETMHVYLLTQKMVETGLSTSVSLLGFLIAGFAIFSSLANPNLLLLMVKQHHPGSGLPYLKYNFFSMIRVFIYFLLFTAFNGVVLFGGQRDGLLSALILHCPSCESYLFWGNRMVFVLAGSFWTVALLVLKSFVFNVHHFVVTMIKFSVVEHNASLKDSQTNIRH
jgi:hypothetical protein